MNEPMHARTVRAVLAFVSALWITGCATDPSVDAAAGDALAQQIVERLAVMEDVAAYKFVHHRPVEDPEREALLLNQMEAGGAALGIPGAVTRRFFEAQMEAAKVVQRERIQQWHTRTKNPPKAIPDLATDVRPLLDRLSSEMLQSLKKAWEARESGTGHPDTRDARVKHALKVSGYSDAVIHAVTEGLP